MISAENPRGIQRKNWIFKFSEPHFAKREQQ
jgi:hypothetical protein